MTVAHDQILNQQSMESAGRTAYQRLMDRDSNGNRSVFRIWVECSEDPQATATHIDLRLRGAMDEATALTDYYTIGTFDEAEGDIQLGGTTVNSTWTWSEPVTGTWFATVPSIPIWPILYLDWSAESSNLVSVWFQW